DPAGEAGGRQPSRALGDPAAPRRALRAVPPDPTATYRLQFGDDAGFAEARRLVPALCDLGIGHVYASPLLAARPGTSGYHVVDPTRLDPSLGTRQAFDGFTDELR